MYLTRPQRSALQEPQIEPGLADGPELDDALTRTAAFARRVFDVAAAAVIRLDRPRVWSSSRDGFALGDRAIAGLVLSGGPLDGMLVVGDTKQDPARAGHALTEKGGVRFLAALPLRAGRGRSIALCLLDTKPNDSVSEEQREMLQSIAELTERVIGFEAARHAALHADNRARGAEALLDEILDASREVVLILDEQGTIERHNELARRVLSDGDIELAGKRLTEMLPPEARDYGDALIRSVAYGGTRVDRAWRLVSLAGRQLEMQVELRPAPGAARTIARMRTADQAASASSRSPHDALTEVGALLDSASQGILTVDPSGRIVAVNARMEKLFGYTRSELEGMPLEKLVPERFRHSHAKQREGYFARPRVRAMGLGMDLAALRKDGTEFPVEISLSYTRVAGTMQAIAFISDISERKRLEGQLMQSQKMEAVGRLAGGVAHDFNNLLTVITGYNRMMLDRLSPMDPLRGFGEEIMKAADRAGALTRQLLAFSRQQMVQPLVLDINALVENMDRMLRRLIGEDVELVATLQPELKRVKADAGQIEQVLMNLVVNARDAMPGGGRITIETSNVELGAEYSRTHIGVAPGEYVMLAVSDTGHGMDADTRRHLFEPFFTTKPQGKGTGLGLSTVYGIVKQSGGDVWVYSEPDHGTTFKIYLPVAEEQPISQRVSNPKPKDLDGHETVLVVEDEGGVRNLVREVLVKHGYDVIEAMDGAEAIRIVEQRGPGTIQLLVTDLVMPRISGKELSDKLCVMDPSLKVLYMSGYTNSTVVRHGVATGSTAFLQKPFTPEGLAGKVREVLDG